MPVWCIMTKWPKCFRARLLQLRTWTTWNHTFSFPTRMIASVTQLYVYICKHSNLRELLEMTCRLANTLKSYGVQKGERVAIYMPVSPVAVAAMLAVPVSVPYTLWCLQGSAQRLWLAEFRMVSKIMLFCHKVCLSQQLKSSFYWSGTTKNNDDVFKWTKCTQ